MMGLILVLEKRSGLVLWRILFNFDQDQPNGIHEYEPLLYFCWIIKYV